jgi:SRSO17 transposase
VAWQLYLPQDWAQDAARRKRTGVPESARFATTTQIAWHQLRTLLSEGHPDHGTGGRIQLPFLGSTPSF